MSKARPVSEARTSAQPDYPALPFAFARQVHGDAGPGVKSGDRVLLVAYHFPPDGSAGALRWEKMLEVLLEEGFQADVLTLDPDQLASPDFTRLAGLPPSVRVFGIRDAALAVEGPWRVRARAIRSVSLLLRRLQIRNSRPSNDPTPTPRGLGGSVSRWEAKRNAGPVLDRWRSGVGARLQYRRFTGWAVRARKLGRWLSREARYEAVIASGPPHFVHPEIASLARRIRAAFVMDMRDPWSLVQRLPASIGSASWWRIAERSESASVRRAALVVCNTARAAAGLKGRYPDVADRIITVMNGVDDEVASAVPKEDRFVIEHAGTVYLDRNPEAVFRAIGRLVRRRDIGPEDLVVRFHGAFDGGAANQVLDIAEREGVGAHVEFGGVVPRAEALRHLAGSAVGLILPQDSHLAVPSKVFEYVNLPIWVIALAQRESATTDVLGRTSAIVVDPLDVPHLEKVIEDLWDRWSEGERPGLGSFDASLARRKQALTFSRQLRRVLNSLSDSSDHKVSARPPGASKARSEDES